MARCELIERIVQLLDVVVVHGLEVDSGDRDDEVAW